MKTTSPSTSDIYHEVASSMPMVEITEQVRVALKRAFPHHLPGFTVHSQKRQAGALLQVQWSNGPTEDDVERVVSAIAEGSFATLFYIGGFEFRSEHQRCPERSTVVRWQFRDVG